MLTNKKVLKRLIREFLIEQDTEQDNSEKANQPSVDNLVVIDDKSGKKYVLSTDQQGVNLFVNDSPYESDDPEKIKEKIAAVVSKAYSDGVIKNKSNLEQQQLIKRWDELTVDGGLETVANQTQRLSVVFDAMSGRPEGKNKLS